MTRSTALGMLKVGNNGNEILQILDVIEEDIIQENINDCAEYYASISAQSWVLRVTLFQSVTETLGNTLNHPPGPYN